jgi:hypothetical protein
MGTRRAVSSSKLRARITGQLRMSIQFCTFCRFPGREPLTGLFRQPVELARVTAEERSLVHSPEGTGITGCT